MIYKNEVRIIYKIIIIKGIFSYKLRFDIYIIWMIRMVTFIN
jgi:hypothetical protein